MSVNLGPLTTTFTPAPECSSSAGIYYVPCTTQGCDFEYWAQGPLSGSSCYPDGYVSTVQRVYYSPGVCPKGYTPACTSYHTISTLTETIYSCCPEASGFPYYCAGTKASWQTTLGCGVDMDNGHFSLTDLIVMDQSWNVESTISTSRTALAVGAYAIEVRFQAGDFTSSSSPTSTSFTQTSSPSQVTIPQTSAPSPSIVAGDSNGNADGSGKVEIGVAVGIGIGSAAAMLIIALGCFLFIRKRKQASQRGLNNNNAPDIQTLSYSPQGISELSERWIPYQLSADDFRERHELGGDAQYQSPHESTLSGSLRTTYR